MDYKDWLSPIYCQWCLGEIIIVEWSAQPDIILYKDRPFKSTQKYWHGPCIQSRLRVFNQEV